MQRRRAGRCLEQSGQGTSLGNTAVPPARCLLLGVVLPFTAGASIPQAGGSQT